LCTQTSEIQTCCRSKRAAGLMRTRRVVTAMFDGAPAQIVPISKRCAHTLRRGMRLGPVRDVQGQPAGADELGHTIGASRGRRTWARTRSRRSEPAVWRRPHPRATAGRRNCTVGGFQWRRDRSMAQLGFAAVATSVPRTSSGARSPAGEEKIKGIAHPNALIQTSARSTAGAAVGARLGMSPEVRQDPSTAESRPGERANVR
jgi:hypothetical protein